VGELRILSSTISGWWTFLELGEIGSSGDKHFSFLSRVSKKKKEKMFSTFGSRIQHFSLTQIDHVESYRDSKLNSIS
jgi:hypothetical protein